METLRRLWLGWKKVARIIGDMIGRLFLSIFYFTLLVPFGLGVRLWSDPLAIKPEHGASWVERTTDVPTMDDARRLA